jgi:hypothetical protein
MMCGLFAPPCGRCVPARSAPGCSTQRARGDSSRPISVRFGSARSATIVVSSPAIMSRLSMVRDFRPGNSLYLFIAAPLICWQPERLVRAAHFSTAGPLIARHRAVNWCPITIVARLRMARSMASTWKSAGYAAPPRLCSSRSRARRASGSKMAPCCASTMTPITATPSCQSVAC